MHVKSVTGAHGTPANGGIPSVELVIVRPKTRGAKTLEVKLDRAMHAPEARVVVIRLKAFMREGDDFVSAQAGDLRTRITLAQLKGRKLDGYRIIVRDEDDNDIAEGAWP